MRKNPIHILEGRIHVQDQAFSRRILTCPQGIDFTSNDYLGFSNDPVLIQQAEIFCKGTRLGSTGSRLLRGHDVEFEQVENTLATFVGQEAALLFPSGYQANVGLFSSLLTPTDSVYSDALNHASIIDGIRLSGAMKRIYPHQDLRTLRSFLEKDNTEALKVIVTESVFSMDGDLAPLPELCALAEEFSALLVVDEAHATGLSHLHSKNQSHVGGGRIQALGLQAFATLHTAGKALGVSGAWIAGSALLKELLIQSARSFIFSTAPSPVLLQLLMASLAHWTQVGLERTEMAFERAQAFQKKWKNLSPHDSVTSFPSSLIFPMILGDNQRALEVAQTLQKQGLDVRAIRPPTVPEHTARLRFTFHANNTVNEIDILALALLDALTSNPKKAIG